MLTFQDCLDLAALTDGEVEAIARHERIPAMVALELGSQLLRSQEGKQSVQQFVIDGVLESQSRNDCRDCARFSRVLGDFVAKHPERKEVGADVALELRELIAIGLAELAPAELPASHRTTVEQIDDAKNRGDCRICAELSLRLVRALERGERAAESSDRRP
jgi:hypothetical protein